MSGNSTDPLLVVLLNESNHTAPELSPVLRMRDQAKEECVVLVASPSARLRRRLTQALSRMFSVYQASDLAKMERQMAMLKPSVLFIDQALTRLDAVKSVPVIQRLSSSTKILLLCDTLDQSEQVLALKAGVKGYCQKDLDHVLIKKAVQMVQKGEIWVERGIIPRLLKELIDRKRPQGKDFSSKSSRLNDLTLRQREIAVLISKGCSNKEISRALNVTQATVKAHIHGIFRKLGVSDRLRLALFVREKIRVYSSLLFLFMSLQDRLSDIGALIT